MSVNTRLLIAIDASVASDQAVAYVADMVQGKPEVEILLFHVAAPMPPELLEFGGRENPAAEQGAEVRLHHAQDVWRAQVTREVQPVIARAQSFLRDRAVPEHAVATQIATPPSGEALDTTILEAARQEHCGTIVVGRTAFSWWHALVRQHLADTLLQQGQGLALWVVQ